MNTVNPWVRFLLITGYIVMLVGAIDPMEGSLLILPGSGLVALGTYLADEERKIFIYRLWVFFLILIGVAALFGFSLLGGIGGTTAYSMLVGITDTCLTRSAGPWVSGGRAHLAGCCGPALSSVSGTCFCRS